MEEDNDDDDRSTVIVNGVTFRLLPPWTWRTSTREGGRSDTVWRAPDGTRIRSTLELSRFVASHWNEVESTLERTTVCCPRCSYAQNDTPRSQGDDERNIRNWITAVLGEIPPGLDRGVAQALWDGSILCRLFCALLPTSVAESSIALRPTTKEEIAANFGVYSEACRAHGVDEDHLLRSSDDCTLERIVEHFQSLCAIVSKQQQQQALCTEEPSPMSTDEVEVFSKTLVELSRGCSGVSDTPAAVVVLPAASSVLPTPQVEPKTCACCSKSMFGRLAIHPILGDYVGQFKLRISLKHPETAVLCSRCYQRNWRANKQLTQDEAQGQAPVVPKNPYACLCGRAFTTPQLKAAHCRSCTIYRQVFGVQVQPTPPREAKGAPLAPAVSVASSTPIAAPRQRNCAQSNTDDDSDSATEYEEENVPPVQTSTRAQRLHDAERAQDIHIGVAALLGTCLQANLMPRDKCKETMVKAKEALERGDCATLRTIGGSLSSLVLISME